MHLLSVPSSKLGLPHPSHDGECVPPLLLVRGVERGWDGVVPIRTRGQTLWLCTLWLPLTLSYLAASEVKVAVSLAYTRSQRGRRASPSPEARPFTAATSSLGNPARHTTSRSTPSHIITKVYKVISQGCGSGSVSGLDPDLIGSVDPDPGKQKWPIKVENFLKLHVLKCWMASLESWRLLL